MDFVKNRAQVQASTAPAQVESKKQSFETWFFKLYFGKSYLDCY